MSMAAEYCGGEVVIIIMPPRLWDCQEPPESVAQAMLTSDVIFTPVSISIAWTKAMRDALENGARSLLMTDFKDEIFTSDALLKTNFEEQEIICNNLAEIYKKARNVHLTSRNGTDFMFQIGGNKVNIVSSVVSKGELGSSPNIEINVVPLEGTSQGKLVVDGSIPYLGIGVLEKPIQFQVKDGFIIDIDEITKEAQLLSENLKSFSNPNVYNIAEFGIGLNPNAKLTGVMLEDEGVFGTIHIGIGTSIALGGKTDAPIHYDLIIKDVKIELDGKLVQENRQIFW
jgi:2,5-dihydroxypyridine 5,6-dioxygenase